MRYGVALTLLGACGFTKPNPEHSDTSQQTVTGDGSTDATTVGTTSSSGSTSTTSESGPTTGGDGSSSSATSGEIAGLADRGLIVRYFLDEAPSGSRPEFLQDASGVEPPLSLQLRYGSLRMPDQMRYFDRLDPPGRGLQWDAASSDAVAFVAVDQTKLSNLQGKSEGTLEVVYEGRAFDSDFSRIIHFGASNESGRFTLRTGTPNSLDLALGHGELNARFLVDNVPSRFVVHLVYDSQQEVPEERARLYLGGTPMPLDPATPVDIVRSRTLDLTGGSVYFALGNRENGSRSFEGEMYYAAVYDVALDEQEVARNAAYLAVTDDPL